MTQRGGKAAPLQQSEGPHLLHVDDDGPSVVAVAQERHDAVGACVSARHHTVVTVDPQHVVPFHAHSLQRGCDSAKHWHAFSGWAAGR